MKSLLPSMLLLLAVTFLVLASYSTPAAAGKVTCSRNEYTPPVIPCEQVCRATTISRSNCGGGVGLSNGRGKCYCKAGYVRSEQTKQCISINDCVRPSR